MALICIWTSPFSGPHPILFQAPRKFSWIWIVPLVGEKESSLSTCQTWLGAGTLGLLIYFPRNTRTPGYWSRRKEKSIGLSRPGTLIRDWVCVSNMSVLQNRFFESSLHVTLLKIGLTIRKIFRGWYWQSHFQHSRWKQLGNMYLASDSRQM